MFPSKKCHNNTLSNHDIVVFMQGMILTLPGKGQGAVVHQHLATLSTDSTKLCVTSYSCSAGAGIFMCEHDNPHHFHMYKFHKF